MEAVEEPPLPNIPVDNVKVSVTNEESEEIAVAPEETDVCHKSNGVADSSESGESTKLETKAAVIQDSNLKPVSKVDVENFADVINIEKPTPSSDPVTNSAEKEENSIVVSSNIENAAVVVEETQDTSKNFESNTPTISSNEVKIEEFVIESTIDRVTFQTEIVVESNDGEMLEISVPMCEETINEGRDTNNLLGELGESIELSEALRSSDITDNVENNNCSAKQEVFNKEELLDILEGNDEDQTGNMTSGTGFPPMSGDKILEAQMALQQLSRLKTKPKKKKSIERLPRKKRQKPVIQNAANTEVKEEDNIVKDLVKEWDDEEGVEVEKSNSMVEENENLSNASDTANSQDSINKQDNDDSVRTSIDSQTADGKTPTLNKSGDETQPQRRLGRVIKKKVIFDPDNPDTFTKSKIIVKSKENVQEKDQTPMKKIKTEQVRQRSKSKSPVTLSKLQWKKPSPKNIKQNKRLTEVDKLLMDEGAVNMIYQLTPEAPKGKKNMKTKAEFIKKIQSSSTPDTKEMKFRERKKESKYEESEARRILGGKQRPSLSSSVKSPCFSEDFEAHSADDSIIYRRHSSSSYSSSCMSPRRLSDVESNSHVTRHPQALTNNDNSDQVNVEIFMPQGAEVIRTEIINKDDCLSIKEKLNSKLNLALKKRKRENSKADKPLKQKKVKVDESNIHNEDFKYLSINFDGKLALICVQKLASVSNIEIIRELERAFEVVNSKKDISVTLLLPESGTTYSDLDLKSLLDDDADKRTSYAYKLAESIRSLLHTVAQHSKLLCAGASGRCSGLALALIGLSDVVLASERASFAFTAKSQSTGPVEPGISVLTSYRNLREPALSDLVVLGRRLSASDALQSGLVSRVLWPEKFDDQVLTIVKDIAAQPAQNILLKKQMLNLTKIGSESTFLSCLEKERDLFVQYWTSIEGQDLLRATYNGA